MNLLSLDKISKSYTGRLLLDSASFYLHENERVGIIGINGTGKSTLLRIIAGEEEGEQGTRTIAGNIVISFLQQNPIFEEDKSIEENVVQKVGNDIWESEAKSLLTRLGFSNFRQQTGELSGGQRKRIALVCSILVPSDILILDEPTNHLDSEMTTWLEGYLKTYKGAIVMVTHDRYFLDLVCNRIVELDKGNLFSYNENYSGFLRRKAEREESDEAAQRKRKSILKKEIAWMERGARARSTKQKAHIQRYEKLAAQKDIEQDDKLSISTAYSRLGKSTIELDNISKSYNDRLLIKDFTYIFLKNDRVGFVGKNGCGKTTLMKLICGTLKPDSGNIYVGQTVKIGYYSQEFINDPSAGIAYMNPELNVIDYIRNTAEYINTDEGQVSASAMLEKFLFTPEMKYSKLSKLSGGEKRRLNLLRVLMEAPNVLILDEPTNDLDIATLQILEDYLDSFSGIVITVSHDRYFLDRVVSRIFAFDEGGLLNQYEGGYTYYESSREDEKKSAITTETKKTKETDVKQNGKPKDTKLKFSYNEQREFETIDDEIAALEKRLNKLEIEYNQNATNQSKLMEILRETEECRNELDMKMERWIYLNELDEKIKSQKNI